MKHDSENNFRSYYRGYPFNGNAMDSLTQPEGGEEIQMQLEIDTAHDQIEKILTMKPFDPEEFGFVKNTYRNYDEYPLMKEDIAMNTLYLIGGDADEAYGYWALNEIQFNSDVEKKQTLYIPNDLAGRIILTALGIVPRRDLDSEGHGCENDDNLDGICELCETSGACMNRLNPE